MYIKARHKSNKKIRISRRQWRHVLLYNTQKSTFTEYIYIYIYTHYTGWPRVGCRIGNLIGSSLVLKCNPTSTEDVQKSLNQGRFL